MTGALRTLDLSGEWRFRPAGSREWSSIRVPGFWEGEGFLELDGSATYETGVDIPACDFATLEFDAVADLCTIFVNDVPVGSHEVGFTPFWVDCSGPVREGRNVVRVEVVDPAAGTPLHLNTIQGKQGWANRFFPSPPSLYMTYGGIWQPCRFVAHGPLYIGDLWSDLDPREPRVGVSLENRSASELSCVVEIEAFGRVERLEAIVSAGGTAEVSTKIVAPGATPWSPWTPTLHGLKASVLLDGQPSHSREIQVGLRSIERAGNDFLINGEPYRMRSALHQGFWPSGLYAADSDLTERDVALALEAGLNTLRTHLKAFEPGWLDAADRLGLMLHCDLPIGEPADPEAFSIESEFGRRCITAAVEQVRRDRSRPSIVMWTLMNEVGLSEPSILGSDGYRDLMGRIISDVRKLDPIRPMIENDWIGERERLVELDVRSPHWYGRATSTFLQSLNEKIETASADDSPLYVTEFGEWGLPSHEEGKEFWDQSEDLATLVAEAGWKGGYDDFAEQTQVHQGWADRIQAERLRTSERVLGFCLTEWTDVPHELNGLVSLRRNTKRSIEELRPALADVCPIAVLDRYAYAEGERARLEVHLSNWSAHDLPPGKLQMQLGTHSTVLQVESVPAGGAIRVGHTEFDAGGSDVLLRVHDVGVSVPLWVVKAERRRRGTVVVVPEDSVDEGAAASLESRAETGARIVVLAQSELVPAFGKPEPIPQTWGPTPFYFTTDAMRCLPARAVLGPEIFHCAPEQYTPNVHGSVGVLIPPPIRRWGSVVVSKDIGRGRIVICHLRIEKGLKSGNGFEEALLAELVELAGGD